jgi:hypothetical protein
MATNLALKALASPNVFFYYLLNQRRVDEETENDILLEGPVLEQEDYGKKSHVAATAAARQTHNILSCCW